MRALRYQPKALAEPQDSLLSDEPDAAVRTLPAWETLEISRVLHPAELESPVLPETGNISPVLSATEETPPSGVSTRKR